MQIIENWEKVRTEDERGRKTRICSMVVLGAQYTHLHTLRVGDEVCCYVWGATEGWYKLLGASAWSRLDIGTCE